MSQNLLIDGTVFNGVDSIAMTKEDGEKVTYVELPDDLGEAVAYIDANGNAIPDAGEVLMTLQKALDKATNGQTVRLTGNVKVGTVIIPAGVTLDLNGKDLTATNVVGMNTSNVIDSLPNTGNVAGGVLKVGRDSLILDSNNAQMPVWTGDGYVFSTILFSDNTSNTGVKLDENNDTAKLSFVPWFDYVDETYVMNNAESAGVKAIVRMTWTTLDDNGNVNGISKQDYVFSDAQLQDVIKAQGKKGLVATLVGYSTKENLTMTAMIISDTKVEIGGTVHNIT